MSVLKTGHKVMLMFNNMFLFNSRYAALNAMQNTSKPDSFFEAIEVRGLPDTPSECYMYVWVIDQA